MEHTILSASGPMTCHCVRLHRGDDLLLSVRELAKQKNIAILSSLHDLNQALYFGDKFFFLKDGVVKYAGGKEIITEEVIRDIFDIAAKIIQINGQKVILGGYCNES